MRSFSSVLIDGLLEKQKQDYEIVNNSHFYIQSGTTDIKINDLS